MASSLRFIRRPRLAVLTAMVAVVVIGVGVTLAPSARAATTIGSNLVPVANTATLCASICSLSQRSLPGAQIAVAPADGVIVRWRIKSGAGTASQPVSLRVVRGTGAASTGAGSSQTENLPAGAGLFTFDTRLPIRAGDFIGLDCCLANAQILFSGASTAVLDLWVPVLADGETRAPDAAFPPGRELLANADMEPDADNDGYGDETQDQCPANSALQETPCDRSPPSVTITKHPKSKTKKKKATFEFTGTDARAISRFQCAIDGGSFTLCSSPFTVKAKKGRHSFAVHAVDEAGNVGAPATFDWKVKKKKR